MVVHTRTEITSLYTNIPQELKEARQWVLWKYGKKRSNKKSSKVPYTPITNQPATVNNPDTWRTFEEALNGFSAPYEGLGFMFHGHSYVGIDLDHCRDKCTGQIEAWAQQIIDRFHSYTEVSPSGTGIHIFIKGAKPGLRERKGKVEMYDNLHYFTMTGNVIIEGPIVENQEELNCFYEETFETQHKVNHSSPPPTPSEITLDDAELIELMRTPEKYGSRFTQLWAGDWEPLNIGDGTQSSADIALCGILAFWTGGDEDRIDDLFRQSGLYRDKWDEKRGDRTYGERTIAKAVNGATDYYTPGKKREYRQVPYPYPFQHQQETQEEREQLLKGIAEQVGTQVVTALQQEGSIAAIASPPGVGKSYTVAEWGKDKNIAYLVPRHAQVDSIPALQQYNHIQAPTPETCENYEFHNELARTGYNTSYAHNFHEVQCIYRQQFSRAGSAVYQIAHSTTTYPSGHTGIVVDEFNLTDWYVKNALTISDIAQAQKRSQQGSAAFQLLRAFQFILFGITEGQAIQGKVLFDRLNDELEGRLERIIKTLSTDYDAIDRYPMWIENEDKAGRVVLPHLWTMLHDESIKWKHGGDWNSYMRIVDLKDGPTLFITEPRRFRARGEQAIPPLVILDATMEEAFLRRWAGKEVTLHKPEIAPPPHTLHIGTRDHRYGKTQLEINKRYQQRTISQAEYLLDRLGADRNKTGLITFKKVLGTIGDELGIPEKQRLNFFGARGSNALEQCETLVIIGTPSLNPEDTYRIARAVYHDDPVPIVEDSKETDKGSYLYRDRRVQQIAEYITRSELTQCAHRNRPLRYDGRTVITFCDSEIDFLPLTEEIISFPTLTERKRSHKQHAEDAIERIVSRGEKLTVRALLEEMPMDRNKAMEYVRQYK